MVILLGNLVRPLEGLSFSFVVGSRKFLPAAKNSRRRPFTCCSTRIASGLALADHSSPGLQVAKNFDIVYRLTLKVPNKPIRFPVALRARRRFAVEVVVTAA